MKEILIAPCGMNCGVCIACQGKKNDLNKRGFNRMYFVTAVFLAVRAVFIWVTSAKNLRMGLFGFAMSVNISLVSV